MPCILLFHWTTWDLITTKKKNNNKKNKAWAEAAASSRISISVLPVVSGIQDKTASMIKKINSRFTHKYILIADNASTSKALVHTLYTLKTRLLLSAVRKCHVFLTVACKHQKQQQSDFNVSTNINAVYFSTLNWAAKVHELLTNLAVHGCRVSLLIMFRWRDYWCYVTGEAYKQRSGSNVRFVGCVLSRIDTAGTW